MLRRNEDIDPIHQLTRLDIKKLRDANTISIYRRPAASGITAKQDSLFDGPTWEHPVLAHSTLKGGDVPPAQIASCHVYISSANNAHTEWRTLANLMKVGDRLELVWYRDAGTNEYMRKAGLHGDRLQIVIHRKNRERYKQMLFLVESQCCEDNTARMIRRGPYNNE